MFKAFIAFVKKETYHILRDQRTLYILFAMPIVLVLIFGYTVTNEFKDASISILNESKDELSEKLTSHLLSSGHFKLISSPKNISEVEESFRKGEIKMAIVIPSEFEKKYFNRQNPSLQILTDATEPNYSATLTNYASRMISTFNEEQTKLFIPYQIDIEMRMMYNPQLQGAYNFIPGVVALILMLICAMMTSLTIAKEKETGTMDLLLVSPLAPMIIIFGKVTPYVVLSFLSAVMVFAMGYYIFDVPIKGSISLLLVLTLLYLLVALALGLLISTKAQSQQTAMMASLFVLLLPTMLLSGFIFPIASMPSLLQFISKIIPAKYFIIIEKAIMLKGVNMESIIQPTAVLALMAFILFLAAWKNFKVRYK